MTEKSERDDVRMRRVIDDAEDVMNRLKDFTDHLDKHTEMLKEFERRWESRWKS